MNALKPITLVIALGASGAALAADDCRRPMAEWQPREAVTARATELGLTTERLRIDDGCYEVRGRDGDGNRISVTLDPATLVVLELDVRFRPGADVSRYLPDARARAGKPVGRAASRPAAPANATN
ncbi:MAG: PepSY domain-containing protein [Burkholderiaceae bacterium]|jgi:hypothetical protein|nr:PepSY domain-containing protein [Burkholderiaceae bacterium]